MTEEERYFETNIANLEDPQEYLRALSKSPYESHRDASLKLQKQYQELSAQKRSDDKVGIERILICRDCCKSKAIKKQFDKGLKLSIETDGLICGICREDKDLVGIQKHLLE